MDRRWSSRPQQGTQLQPIPKVNPHRCTAMDDRETSSPAMASQSVYPFATSPDALQRVQSSDGERRERATSENPLLQGREEKRTAPPALQVDTSGGSVMTLRCSKHNLDYIRGCDVCKRAMLSNHPAFERIFLNIYNSEGLAVAHSAIDGMMSTQSSLPPPPVDGVCKRCGMSDRSAPPTCADSTLLSVQPLMKADVSNGGSSCSSGSGGSGSSGFWSSVFKVFSARSRDIQDSGPSASRAPPARSSTSDSFGSRASTTTRRSSPNSTTRTLDPHSEGSLPHSPSESSVYSFTFTSTKEETLQTGAASLPDGDADANYDEESLLLGIRRRNGHDRNAPGSVKV